MIPAPTLIEANSDDPKAILLLLKENYDRCTICYIRHQQLIDDVQMRYKPEVSE